MFVVWVETNEGDVAKHSGLKFCLISRRKTKSKFHTCSSTEVVPGVIHRVACLQDNLQMLRQSVEKLFEARGLKLWTLTVWY